MSNVSYTNKTHNNTTNSPVGKTGIVKPGKIQDTLVINDTEKFGKLLVIDKTSGISKKYIGHTVVVTEVTYDSKPDESRKGVYFVKVEHSEDCEKCHNLFHMTHDYLDIESSMDELRRLKLKPGVTIYISDLYEYRILKSILNEFDRRYVNIEDDEIYTTGKFYYDLVDHEDESIRLVLDYETLDIYIEKEGDYIVYDDTGNVTEKYGYYKTSIYDDDYSFDDRIEYFNDEGLGLPCYHAWLRRHIVDTNDSDIQIAIADYNNKIYRATIALIKLLKENGLVEE